MRTVLCFLVTIGRYNAKTKIYCSLEPSVLE